MEQLTQREKAKLHTAELWERRQRKLLKLEAPEPAPLNRRQQANADARAKLKAETLSGYELYLAAKQLLADPQAVDTTDSSDPAI